MITEDDRKQIMAALETRNSGLWVEAVSELHEFGAELPFWFLVDSEKKICAIFEQFLLTIESYLKRFVETKFSVAFEQCVEGDILFWNYVEDEEIRSGSLAFPLAEKATRKKLRSSVFKSLQPLIKN